MSDVQTASIVELNDTDEIRTEEETTKGTAAAETGEIDENKDGEASSKETEENSEVKEGEGEKKEEDSVSKPSGPISPEDDFLTTYILSLRSAPSTSSLGIPKILSKLKIDRPQWTVSEKRLRKLIGNNKAKLGPKDLGGGGKWDFFKRAADGVVDKVVGEEEGDKTKADGEAGENTADGGDVNKTKEEKTEGEEKEGEKKNKEEEGTELAVLSSNSLPLDLEPADPWYPNSLKPGSITPLILEMASELAKPSTSKDNSLTNGTSSFSTATTATPSPPPTGGKGKKGKGRTKSNAAQAAVAAPVAGEVDASKPNGTTSEEQPSTNEEVTTVATSTTSNSLVSPFWAGEGKGRGVKANEECKEGKVLWMEDAKVWVPLSQTLSKAMMMGDACGFCGKIFPSPRSKLIQPCSFHSSTPTSTTTTSSNHSRQRTKSNSQQLSTTTTTDSSSPSAPGVDPAPPCHLKFCNRVCQQKSSANYGPFCCPTRNPEYADLCKWGDDQEWRAPITVFKMWVRQIMAWKKAIESDTLPTNQHDSATAPLPQSNSKTSRMNRRDALRYAYGENELRSVRDTWDAFAAASERTRKRREAGILADFKFGGLWRHCFLLVLRALHLPEANITIPTDSEDISKSPSWIFFQHFYSPFIMFPDEYAKDLFTFEGFFRDLGLVGVNQEDDGGLYLLHSCINHSCDPNCTVRKTPFSIQRGNRQLSQQAAQDARPSRIYIVAKRPIKAGEELTVSYINPEAHLVGRRDHLRKIYLFECDCDRCVEELKDPEVQELELKHRTESMEQTFGQHWKMASGGGNGGNGILGGDTDGPLRIIDLGGGNAEGKDGEKKDLSDLEPELRAALGM